MLLYAIYACVLMGVVAVAVLVAPQPSPAVRLPRMPSRVLVRAPSSRPAPLVPLLALLGRAFPHSGGWTDVLRTKLAYVRSRLSVEGFLGLKAVMTVGTVAAAAVVLREAGALSPLPLVLAAAIGFVLPDLWLRGRVGKRQRAIIRLLPEVTDLLMLCIGAGLDFLGSLNRVVGVKAFRKEPMVEELSVVLQEIKLGKRRFEALKAMAKRVDVAEINSFVRTLVQADRMGTPIGEVLSVHSEDVRFQRFQRAEREALKAPIKILVPLIFFIMPCVAIIVGAPIFLQFLKQNPFGK